MARENKKRKTDAPADVSHSKRPEKESQGDAIQGVAESSGAQSTSGVNNQGTKPASPTPNDTAPHVGDGTGNDIAARGNTDKGDTGRDGIRRDNAGRADTNSHKIIVGVDYGTTYTGVSYVATDKRDTKDIAVITSWPGPSRDTEAVYKVPSRIAYPFDNPGIQTIKCGFQVEGRMKSYSWTKLLLDSRTPATSYDDADLEVTANMGILKVPEGKVAARVVTDFLESIYKHTMSMLAKQISQNSLDATPIEFWFTVPAIWSDEAQHATRTAAQLAGFTSRSGDTMFMIPEPEAAAIATLKKSTTDALSVPIKPGDGILICDCGGGTVDITTYLIMETSPRLQFEELCPGTGGKCGSSSIDRNLYRLMSERFGAAFNDLPSHRKGPGSEFMRGFEEVKHDFGYSDEDRIYELPLNMTVTQPNSSYFDEDERLVKITSEDVRRLFDPVIERIISLIKEQLTAANSGARRPAIENIILAGGFGDSEYLRRALAREFASCSMKITVPAQPQAAIVKGAALRGLEGIRPAARRCRRHYGYVMGVPFREGIDSEEYSYIDLWEGTKYVNGIMNWVVTKGTKVLPDTMLRRKTRVQWYDHTPARLRMYFFACDLDEPVGRIGCTGAYHVGTVIYDCSGIDPKVIHRKVNHEGKWVNLVFVEVQVFLGAKEGVLSCQITANGKVVGKTDINFGDG